MNAKIDKSTNRQINKQGFTLSEVLITLMVIGVVAALAIPALLTTTNKAEYKTLYKKAFAIASQAWLKGNADATFIARSSYDDGPSNYHNFNAFKSYFIVTKLCDNNNTYDCWENLGEKSNSAPTVSAHSFIDSSGMAWAMRGGEAEGFTTSIFLVDTNSFKGPNKFGRDRFIFKMENSSGSISSGIPVKIGVLQDYSSTDTMYCPSGGCYYTSWLLNSK